MLDDTTLSLNSWLGIVLKTPEITDASLVGLRFDGVQPGLSTLLRINSLDNLTVDEGIYESYTDELDAFAVEAGNTLSVVFYGDANRDGKFNSSDLVQVLASGTYEDDVPGNSYWTEGDWNSDGDFNTADLIVAFSAGIDSVGGRYEQDAQVNVVPEPSTAMLLLMGLAAVIRTTTRYRR